MAQPIYFLPDLRESAADSVALRRQVLKERGLLEVFADVPHVEQPLTELKGRGPDNRAGCLLCYQTPAGQIPRRWGYYPDEQTWTPVGDGSLLWIGVDPAEPPKPEEMARKRQYPGYRLELGDGNLWSVPIIRRPDGSTELPTDMVWDAAGRLVEPIKPAYVSYWEASADAAAYFYDGMEETRLTKQRAFGLAIVAISLNYRFGNPEQNVTRVIDRMNYLSILAATVDVPGSDLVIDAQKKMGEQPSEPSTTPG